MQDKFVIVIVVALIILVHWFLYRWVRFKINEGLILQFLDSSPPREDHKLEEIAEATNMRLIQAKKICSKSKMIVLQKNGKCRHA